MAFSSSSSSRRVRSAQPMANRVSLRRQTTRSAGWSKCFFHWFATKQTSWPMTASFSRAESAAASSMDTSASAAQRWRSVHSSSLVQNSVS